MEINQEQQPQDQQTFQQEPDNTIEVESIVVDNVPEIPEQEETKILEAKEDKPKIALDLEDYRLFSQTLWNIPGMVLESHPYLTDEEVEPFVMPFYKFCMRHPEIDILALFPDLMFLGSCGRMIYLISEKHNKYYELKKHENRDNKESGKADVVKNQDNRFKTGPSTGQ